MKKAASFAMALLVISVLSALISFGEAESTSFSDEFVATTLDDRWNWVDPQVDCSYSLTANLGYLRIYVPYRGNDLYLHTNLNAPRVIQSASGNFIIETRVIIAPQYDAQGAGILIWKDSDNYLRLDRVVHFVDRQVVELSGEKAGEWFYFAETPYTNTDTYLRLERTADTFVAKYSSDGTNWKLMSSIFFLFVDPVNVGLFVINEYQDNPIYADFDYFRVSALLAVGGIMIPVDKFGLLAPYIGLTSTIIVATIATSIYVRRVKPRKEKQ
jgi:regulation of enolase protein 1 (concanavalin A-like superfamily)